TFCRRAARLSGNRSTRSATGRGPTAACLARSRGRTADRTYEAGVRIMGMRNKAAFAAFAIRKLKLVAVEETDQHPGAGETEHRFFARLGSKAPGEGLFRVQTVGLNQRPRLGDRRVAFDIAIDAVKNTGVDVGQPRHEPVDRERQHALGWRTPPHFPIQARQTIVTEAGFGLQNLQARTELDHVWCQQDLFGLFGDAFLRHDFRQVVGVNAAPSRWWSVPAEGHRQARLARESRAVRSR